MEYFEKVPKIQYEGSKSKNPLAFKEYNPSELIGGKTMAEHLKFSMAYWHSLCADGADPFGAGARVMPWVDACPMKTAENKVEAAFEFLEKLSIPYYCFHDRDVAPEGKTLRESNQNLDHIVELLQKNMARTGKKLLWGTANAFNHPRYVHGAATSCNAEVFAYAAGQIKKAIEVTHALGGENYVFWGGREGYETLLNTDMELELDNFGRMLHMAVDYARKIGFTGQFLIEPKPKEPTKHQYDFDVQTVLAFLRKYDLEKEFKVNIEANHATLAEHTFEHELYVARINGVLGSVDANQGDPNLGWDTDQFPTNIYSTAFAMVEILKNGGLGKGGLNFDAKPRRASFEPLDLAYSHIAGMDAFAKGLRIAYRMLEDKVLEDFIKQRYSSYEDGIGAKIKQGAADFEVLEAYILDKETIENQSGRQEMLEGIVNQYMFG